MWNSVQMRETSIFKKLFLVRTREIPLITLRTPPPMSFTGSLALIAISYTLVNQEEDLATDSEHLPDVERNDKDASKSVARYFYLPDYSKQHMAVCSLSLNLGSLESRKTLEQKFIFRSAFFIPTISTSAFHSTNSFLFSRNNFPHIKPHTTHNYSNRSAEGLTLEKSAFKLLTVANLRLELRTH